MCYHAALCWREKRLLIFDDKPNMTNDIYWLLSSSATVTVVQQDQQLLN